MRFHLSKWYLDCVTDDGTTAILYWARLRWGILRIHYGAVLTHAPSHAPGDRHTLHPGDPPITDPDGSVRWSCPRLRVSGTWRRAATPAEQTLLDDDTGRIEWSGVCPRADAVLDIDGRAIRGLGYVERLTSTVPPGRLPFDELRWGRFLTPSEAVTWISWRGAKATARPW